VLALKARRQLYGDLAAVRLFGALPPGQGLREKTPSAKAKSQAVLGGFDLFSWRGKEPAARAPLARFPTIIERSLIEVLLDRASSRKALRLPS
jgi:hypothetical protein